MGSGARVGDAWDVYISTDEVNEMQASFVPPPMPPGLLKGRGCVEGSLGAALSAVGYVDEPAPDVLRFAAGAAYYLAKNHCYNNANKRIGLAAAFEVLLRHNLTFDRKNKTQIKRLVKGAVAGTVALPELCRWMADHVEILPAA